MIIITKDDNNNQDNFNNFLEQFNIQKIYLNTVLESQNKQKDVFLNIMQKFVDSENEIKQTELEKVVSILEKAKSSLDFCNDNTTTIKDLITKYNKLELEFTIDNYHDLMSSSNLDTLNILNQVTKNSTDITNCLNDLIVFSHFNFQEEKQNEEVLKKELSNNTKIESIKPNKPTSSIDTNTKKASNENKSSSKIQQENFKNYEENTLLISEKQGKVYLPFTISELNELYNKQPDNYDDLESVLEEHFVLELTHFKNAPLARFKESFKLARRENMPLLSAFDLGMELMFSYNLHPAIITACKDSDELDIYLDYLDENKTTHFKCFNIVFDAAPLVIKKGRKLK